MDRPDTTPVRRWPHDVRIILLRLLPWAVVISIAGALSYLRLLDMRLTPLRNSARLLIEQGVSVTTSDLGNLSRDTLVLGQSPALTSALSGAQPAAAVGTALLIHARASRPYARIAWIDESGRERARIDTRDGIAVLVDPTRLQRPAQMPWLHDLRELLPAEARFAPIDVQDSALWLRVASPVYDLRGRQRGMVVIHHDFRRTLAQIHALDASGPGGADPLALLDPEGRAIGATARKAATLAMHDPELWREITQQGRGRREGEDGMWFYQDFLPAEPGPGRVPLQSWYFLAHVSAQSVQELRGMSAMQSGGACALALGLAVIATVRRRQIEREREQLLADLQANHLALAAAKAEVDTSLQQLRQLQAELVQAEKLASLGLLVAGVAHELNTPLGSAKVTASTMARRLGDAERLAGEHPGPVQWRALLANQRAGLEIIDHSLERSGQVIRLFKQLAVDRGAVERRQFALDDLMQDVQRLLAPRLREAGATLDIAPTSGVQLDSYPGPLGQVIENLVVNALMHAFDPAPASDADRSGQVQVQFRTDAASQELQIDVVDNGNGIDPLILPRIFDPFFTTRRGRGGTGIGLHLCHHFCTQLLGGRISVDSSVRQGTRFTVRIPLQAP